MIIKKKRKEPGSDEADSTSRAARGTARESALRKGSGFFQPPEISSPPRRSSIVKRGTYRATVAEAPAQHASTVADDGGGRVLVPTGDPPPAPPSSVVELSGVTVVPVGPPVDQQIIDEARRRSEAILRQSQLDAKKLVEEAKIHCQNALQQAEKEGFEQGRKLGYESIGAEMATLILQVRQMLADAVFGREKVLRSAEGEIATLALRIAERVTATAVTTDPQIIKNQVATALDRVKDREHVSVHVHPQDLDVVRSRKEMFTKLLEGPKTFEIQADPKVDRGGVIIETNQGNVDARVSTQLQALQLAFAEVEKRQRLEWERAAQEASQQVMDVGLPPELVSRVAMSVAPAMAPAMAECSDQVEMAPAPLPEPYAGTASVIEEPA